MVTGNADTGHKLYEVSDLLKQKGNELFKSSDFKLSLKLYTKGLLFAPTHDVKEEDLGSKDATEYPLAVLYSNRSASCFKLKEYKHCILDIERAFANGRHDPARQIKLLCRLAWSYWHLKQYKRCAEIVQNAALQQTEKKYKDIARLKSLIENNKSASIGTDSEKALNMKKEKTENSLFNKSKEINGASSNVKLSFDPVKGRYLTAKSGLKPGDGIITEEAYCGALNHKFLGTYCNYCYKECKLHGIPCHGCSGALYCDETCRLKAWKIYHWLECSMFPVLDKIDMFSRVAFRTLLHGAHHFPRENLVLTSDKSEESFNPLISIAAHIHELYPTSSNKTTRNRKKSNKTKQHRPPQVVLDGRNPKTKVYSGDYWSLYCLQAHADKQSKAVVVKCGLYANYLAKVISQCLVDKPKKVPENSITATASLLKSLFMKLNFATHHQQDGKVDSASDIETLRRRVLLNCIRLAPTAPSPKLKQQNVFQSKDPPQNFQELLAYLLKRHMLQLYTNTQAIFDVICDDEDVKDVSTMSQQRVAIALFPSTSLLNHSCSPNTIITFTGRRVLVRAIQSINVGGEISHCYGPCISRHSYQDRQDILNQQYFFTCECDACLKYKRADDDERAYLQQFTAYKCKKCEGPMLILSGSAKDGAIIGRCADVECQNVHDLSEADGAYYDFVNISQVVSQKLVKNEFDDGLTMLLNCMKGMDEFLYRNHQAKATLHDQIAYCYSHKKDYVSAAKHLCESLKITSMRFGNLSLETARESFKLASVYVNARMPKEAEKFVTKALNVFRKILPAGCPELKKAEDMITALHTYYTQMENFGSLLR